VRFSLSHTEQLPDPFSAWMPHWLTAMWSTAGSGASFTRPGQPPHRNTGCTPGQLPAGAHEVLIIDGIIMILESEEAPNLPPTHPSIPCLRPQAHDPPSKGFAHGYKQ